VDELRALLAWLLRLGALVRLGAEEPELLRAGALERVLLVELLMWVDLPSSSSCPNHKDLQPRWQPRCRGARMNFVAAT
jgi:hypothetical protein